MGSYLRTTCLRHLQGCFYVPLLLSLLAPLLFHMCYSQSSPSTLLSPPISPPQVLDNPTASAGQALGKAATRTQAVVWEEGARPVQLLMPGSGHDSLELNYMILERLADIPEPIAFVAVVGPYHGCIFVHVWFVHLIFIHDHGGFCSDKI